MRVTGTVIGNQAIYNLFDYCYILFDLSSKVSELSPLLSSVRFSLGGRKDKADFQVLGVDLVVFAQESV